MTLEEAIAINGDVVSFCAARILGNVPKPLSREYTLKELVDARDIVEAQNNTPCPDKPGYVIMRTTADDRIIAAMYAMLNFDPEHGKRPEPILVGIDRAIFCVRLKHTREIEGTDNSVFCPYCDAEEEDAWEIAACPGEWQTFHCRDCGKEYQVLNDSTNVFRSREVHHG